MVVTQAEIGRRIRVAREASSLTQEQVGEALGIPRSAVVQLEAGRRSVSSVELVKLAQLLGRDVGEFVEDQEFQAQDPLQVLFRAEAGAIESPAIREALRACLALGRELAKLERILGIRPERPPFAIESATAPNSRWEAIQQGERLAKAERRRLELGSAPVAYLIDLLDGEGIRTGVIDLPPDVSGLTFFDREAGPVVVVNAAHNHLRQRFSFAHEYAHVLLDHARKGLVSLASDRADLLEVRANAFAASFLMPEEGVRQLIASLGKGQPSRARTEVYDEAGSVEVEGRAAPGTQTLQLYDIVHVAHHFGVSRVSALYRLLNLKLLTKREFEALRLLEESGKGKALAEALELPDLDSAKTHQHLHHRFFALALEAYRRDEISRSKVRELGAQARFSPERVEAMIDETRIEGSEPGHE